MKPFDLQKSLAGAPVITRYGEPVTDIRHHPSGRKYSVSGVIDGSIDTFTESGKFREQEAESMFDLFMAPVKRKIFVNVYRGTGGKMCAGAVHDSEEAAARANISSVTFVSTLTAEIEE
ncbi:MAG: hypothetical protein ACTHKB_11525 [Burkholderiaceae bacterium]